MFSKSFTKFRQALAEGLFNNHSTPCKQRGGEKIEKIAFLVSSNHIKDCSTYSGLKREMCFRLHGTHQLYKATKDCRMQQHALKIGLAYHSF